MYEKNEVVALNKPDLSFLKTLELVVGGIWKV
jgi:hypothetical protein